MGVPQGTTRTGFDKPRGTGSDEGFRKLARTVDPNHEERQTALPDALQRREPMSKLLETHAEAPLQDRQVVAGRLASAQKATIRHQQGCRHVTCQVTSEERASRLFVEFDRIGDGSDRLGEFQLG